MGPKTLSPNRFQLKKAVGLSLLAHACLASLFLFSLHGDSIEKASGNKGGEEYITVSLVRASADGLPTKQRNRPSSDGNGQKQLEKEIGEGGEGGSSDILRQIRNKIKRAKFYALRAKRLDIQGRPVMEFKIRQDGTLEYVVIKESSGSKILDEAALSIIKQAQPFPFYPEPIKVGIEYNLK